MRLPGRWWQWAVVGIVAALLGGRWLASWAADRQWAEALGVGATHAQLAELRLGLVALAVLAAAVWCLGNLYMVYHSIGSIHVPRRLGNLEFVEALPPRRLLIIVVVLGMALAGLLSHDAVNWWRARALAAEWHPLGIVDPVLRRDVGEYLFVLPWHRRLHGFVTVGAGLMVAVSAVLYAAVGAVRWTERRLVVLEPARLHLGALLAVFALALFWGYRLEPAEYVAGVHGVPVDAILIDVRLPTARLLSSLALVVAGASLLWMWSGRVAVVLVSWSVLGIVSFAGHYVVPAFAAAVRTPEDIVVPAFTAAQPRLRALAYGLDERQRTIDAQTATNPAANPERRAALARVPVWDSFAVTTFLNHAVPEPGDAVRYAGVSLAADAGRTGRVPVYLGAREPDFASAKGSATSLTWSDVHAGPYHAARGLVAVAADAASPSGLPQFIPDLGTPDNQTATVTQLDLSAHELLFAPRLDRFALATDSTVIGVSAGGFVRRAMFAWLLQSPRLLTTSLATARTRVLWRRSVVDRLQHFAPFIEFGRPYPAVVDGRWLWLAPGYTAIESFPLAPGVEWHGRTVHGLDAGWVGIVDGATGDTRVYLLPDAGPVALAWSRFVPDIALPADSLPRRVAERLQFPAELFRLQNEFVAQDVARGEATPGQAVPEHPTADGAWWFGPAAGDGVARLRLVASVARGEPSALVAVVDGTVVDGRRRLTVTRVLGAAASTADLARGAAELRPDTASVPGALHLVALDDGVLGLQASYRGSNATTEPPRLVDVALMWNGLAVHGSSLALALEELARVPPMARGEGVRWLEAQRWFERMDAARRQGDWAAFGRAYDALRRLLGSAPDTTR